MAKVRHVVGIAVLAAVVLAAGTVAARSADGLPEIPSPAASSTASTATATPTPTATAASPVTFGVVGDSITAWIGQEEGSWTSYVDDDVLFTEQGWAQNGAPLALMKANTPRMNADVLVVLAGTNDLVGTLTVSAKLGLLDDIVEESGVDRVLISSVPPYDLNPVLSTAWNRELKQHAAAAGYDFVDSWVNARTADGTFIPAHTVDGIHPTPGAASQAAAVIGRAIVRADR